MHTSEMPGTVAASACKRLLHAKDDLGAELCDQRRIAHELQRIAEALLGAEENRLALQIRFALPHRLRIIGPVLREGFLFPAILVSLPAFAQLAQAKFCDGQIEIGLGTFRLERQRIDVTR